MTLVYIGVVAKYIYPAPNSFKYHGIFEFTKEALLPNIGVQDSRILPILYAGAEYVDQVNVTDYFALLDRCKSTDIFWIMWND